MAETLRGKSRVEILGPGTVNADEYQRLQKLFPSGTDWSPIQRRNALDYLEQMNKLTEDGYRAYSNNVLEGGYESNSAKTRLKGGAAI